MRRPVHLIASLAVHAALLALYACTGPHFSGQAAQQQRRMAASSSPDSHAAMRARVSDMERIKDLMRESIDGAQSGAAGPVRFDATTAAPRPADLLAQAEALARDIDALAARAHAASPAPQAQIPAGDAPQAPAAPVTAQETAREAMREAAPAPAAGAAASAASAAMTPGVPAQGGAKASAAATAAVSATATASATGTGSATGPAPATGAASAGAAADGAPAGAGAAAGMGSAAMAARIAVLEQHARDVLVRRQDQLRRGGPDGKPDVSGGPEDVAERIAAFVNRDVPAAPVSTGHYFTNGMELFRAGAGRMANVDTAAMRKGAARLFGAGGVWANRVYVNSWYVIGPFAGRHGDGMFANAHYPPEQAVVLDAAYRGKDGRILTWRYLHAAGYPLVPPDPQEDSVYYGYTELMMDSARELAVWIGADDDAQVWINDELVWKGGNVNKRWFFQQIYDRGIDYGAAYNLNEGKVLVRFRPGRNKLFFKLSNGPSRLFFSMVLTPP